MVHRDVIARLERALAAPLPGASAHAALAPRPRRQWPPGVNPARIRNAAGLLLVFPAGPGASRRRVEPALDRESSRIILTVRAGTLGRHGGQVSLPGGVVDPGETFEQAALREAQEEIGLAPGAVRVLGALTPIDIAVSGFRLHPVVAAAPERPALTPHDAEVAAIVELDLDELADPSSLVETVREREGAALVVPAFQLAGVEIWGATAMVLAEFLVLLGWRQELLS